MRRVHGRLAAQAEIEDRGHQTRERAHEEVAGDLPHDSADGVVGGERPEEVVGVGGGELLDREHRHHREKRELVVAAHEVARTGQRAPRPRVLERGGRRDERVARRQVDARHDEQEEAEGDQDLGGQRGRRQLQQHAAGVRQRLADRDALSAAGLGRDLLAVAVVEHRAREPEQLDAEEEQHVGDSRRLGLVQEGRGEPEDREQHEPGNQQ